MPYVPEPLHAEHMPFSHRDLNPKVKTSCRVLEPLTDQLQAPEPLHTLQTSTLPVPSQTVHSTICEVSAALPIKT